MDTAVKSYPVGQAPWETSGTPSSFPVGKAPWEVPTQAPATPVTPTKDFSTPDNPNATMSPADQLDKMAGAVSSVFPGGKVGEAIGTLGGYAWTALQEKLGMVPKGTTSNYDLSAPTPLQVGGDIAQGALTVAAPEIGSGETAIGRIGANAALGAGLGATGAIAKGQSGTEIVKQGALGGAIGGGSSAIMEGVGALAKNMPNWLAKLALPKLNPGNEGYALESTPLGSTKTMLAHSKDAIASYSDQISGILSHPEYSDSSFLTKQAAEGKSAIFDQLVNSFPNSEYTNDELVGKIKDIIPGQAKLVDKIANESATLQEQNEVRSALDVATKSVYTSLNRPPESKAVAQGLADILRDNIQTNAPETKPIFQNFSKEINLNGVLRAIDKKNNMKPTLTDFITAYGGYKAGGIPGAIEAIAAERLLGSTGGKMALAKGANLISGATPAIGGVLQGIKAPLLKKVTGE